jgi:hypothetical protein
MDYIITYFMITKNFDALSYKRGVNGIHFTAVMSLQPLEGKIIGNLPVPGRGLKKRFAEMYFLIVYQESLFCEICGWSGFEVGGWHYLPASLFSSYYSHSLKVSKESCISLIWSLRGISEFLKYLIFEKYFVMFISSISGIEPLTKIVVCSGLNCICFTARKR